MKSLRLCFLAPLKRPLTEETASSRPHLVYELIAHLRDRGHHITVIGTGDTAIEGVETIPVLEKCLAVHAPVENPFYLHTAGIAHMMLELVARASAFDLIHNHLYPEFFPLLFADRIRSPMVTTIHAQMTPELVAILSRFPDAHFVSISQAHARMGKGLQTTVVYNGINEQRYRFTAQPDDAYLLFLGRMTGAKNPHGQFLDPKGVLTAIAVAEKTGKPLRISGNVEDRRFYDEKILPHLSDQIRFIGPVSGELALSKEEVVSLMQHARCLLFPINWEEPFGLVMTESMACGTPVVAYNRGSVPEIIADGRTGFVVSPDNGMDGLCEAVDRLYVMPQEEYAAVRLACRKHVEEQFTVEKMVDRYEEVYKKVVGGEW